MKWFRVSRRAASRFIAATVTLALSAPLLPAGIPRAHSESPTSIISVPADGVAAGEVSLVREDGTKNTVIKGLTNPTIVDFLPTGELLVVDGARRQILTFASNSGLYGLEKTSPIPPEMPELTGAHRLRDGSTIIFERAGRVGRIFADSRFEMLSQPAAPLLSVNRTAKLSEERFLIVVSNPKALGPSLYQFDVPSRRWDPVGIAPDTLAQPLNPNSLAGSGRDIIAWLIGNSIVRYGSVDREVFTASSVVSAMEPGLLVSDGEQGIYQSGFDGTFRHTDRSGATRELFQFFPVPKDMAYDSDTRQFALAYQNPTTISWPDILAQWYSSPGTFSWSSFLLTTLIGAFLGGFWLVTCGLRGSLPLENIHNQKTVPSPTFSRALITVILIAIGFAFAANGHLMLLRGEPSNAWLPPYLFGACLVAAASEALRRRYPPQHEPPSMGAILSGAAPSIRRAFAAPAIGIFALVVGIISLGTDTPYFGLREGLFCAALILAMCLCLADLFQARSDVKVWARREWWMILSPLLLGCATLFYRLLDIPNFCHHDFTLHAFEAQMFLEGRMHGAWTWGFVPAPILGAFPEMVGLMLAGPTPLGFRLGSSLFNLSGILAVYLLGRTYRSPRVGFWAAILLAGCIPHMHFGRLPSNGFAATTALWGLTVFALAIRYQRAGLWLMLGIVCGFSFYLWPVARVGMVAVAATSALIVLRYPISQAKRWKLYLMALLGFTIMIAPLIPIWAKSPILLMPRATESLVAFSWKSSFVEQLSKHPALILLVKSVGWIFNQPDASSQGTVSPGSNSVEAILFACGFAIALIEGFSLNILLLTLFIITTIVCGVFADGTPWYTRLLPTAPVVAILAARALEGAYNSVSALSGRITGALFVVISAALVWVSPIKNFHLYESFETGSLRPYPWHPSVAIARRMHELGPKYTYVLLARGEDHFRIEQASAFGEMLPYIMNLRVREVYDLDTELELARKRPTAFIIQLKREAVDIPTILKAYPSAHVQTIVDINGTPVAKIALVETSE